MNRHNPVEETEHYGLRITVTPSNEGFATPIGEAFRSMPAADSLALCPVLALFRGKFLFEEDTNPPEPVAIGMRSMFFIAGEFNHKVAVTVVSLTQDTVFHYTSKFIYTCDQLQPGREFRMVTPCLCHWQDERLGQQVNELENDLRWLCVKARKFQKLEEAFAQK